jgi:glucokinase
LPMEGATAAMNRPEPVLLGVDVGSTTTAAGLVTPAGDVLAALQADTHRDGPGTALDLLLDLVGDLLAQAGQRGLRVDAIGVGLPGLVDIEGGTMRKGFHRVPELAGAPLVERLHARSGVPVFIDNDVNALALGEWTWGPGRGATSMVVLALGTGVGGAVILDGHLVRGKAGSAGELGHVSVNFDGRRCVCGIRGCLSVYAAGFGMAAEYQRRTRGDADGRLAEANYAELPTDGDAVFRAADAGNAEARTIIEEACRAVGVAIGGIVNGLNPEVIVLTGGILTSLARWESRILAHAAEFGFASSLADAQIHFVPGYKNQTVRGGAALVLYERARRTLSSVKATDQNDDASQTSRRRQED